MLNMKMARGTARGVIG